MQTLTIFHLNIQEEIPTLIHQINNNPMFKNWHITSVVTEGKDINYGPSSSNHRINFLNPSSSTIGRTQLLEESEIVISFMNGFDTTLAKECFNRGAQFINGSQKTPITILDQMIKLQEGKLAH